MRTLTSEVFKMSIVIGILMILFVIRASPLSDTSLISTTWIVSMLGLPSIDINTIHTCLVGTMMSTTIRTP